MTYPCFKSSLHRWSRNYRRWQRLFIPLMTAVAISVSSPAWTQISTIPGNNINTNVNAIAQNRSTRETQARQLYQTGKYEEAAKLFRQAAKEYQVRKDPIRQALSLSNLSLCHQQLGAWQEADQAITEAVNLVSSIQNTQPATELARAQILEIQATLLSARGRGDAAFPIWEQVTKIYTQQKQPQQALISQVNQAQVLQSMGLHRRSIRVLETALSLSQTRFTEPEKLKPALEKIAANRENLIALRSLGDSLRVTGNVGQAQVILERSLAIAQTLNSPELTALVNLTLGNTARAQLRIDQPINAPIQPPSTEKAIQYYQQAATQPGSLRIQSLANHLGLLVDTKQINAAKNLIPTLQQELAGIVTGRTAIDGRINLAFNMMRMRQQDPTSVPIKEVADTLAVAIQQARNLGNPRIYADALGTLGHVYEQNQQWAEAQKVTQEAVQVAQQSRADDIAYRWQWQLGRVLAAQNQNEQAIASYQEAVNTIKSLRADLAAADPNVQFSFRDAVEPIHRQLVSLLVKSTQDNNLRSARDIIEGLQLVELDNFFREACLNAKPEQVDQVDEKAAVVYPIILDKELAMITSLPNLGQAEKSQEKRLFRYYKTDIPRDEVEKLAIRLRESFNQDTTSDLARPQLQRMYNLMLRPAMSDIDNSKVETLVFVLDGVLRSVPVAALDDGKQFLIEKYSIALTPGLQLLTPKALKQESLRALVAGISEPRSNFSALPFVRSEIRKIESEIPSQVLLNETFTNREFQARISDAPFPIVHLATHGQFGSTLDTTFILTWDGQIKVNQLSGLLQTVELSQDKSLEMLILSACETAAGDARSALGLAGVAVRSGARSTIATLWRVNDKASADLMSVFYEELKQVGQTGISKAEALRRAQVKILKTPEYKSPYYWAAYVLLGNWT